MNHLRLTIPGPPKIQERMRKGMYGQIYDPVAKAKAELSEWFFYERLKAKVSLFMGDVGIEVVFHGMEKGDLDNALKFLLDAGNESLWKDDRQIIAIEANVIRKDNNPRTELYVREIEGEKPCTPKEPEKKNARSSTK